MNVQRAADGTVLGSFFGEFVSRTVPKARAPDRPLAIQDVPHRSTPAPYGTDGKPVPAELESRALAAWHAKNEKWHADCNAEKGCDERMN